MTNVGVSIPTIAIIVASMPSLLSKNRGSRGEGCVIIAGTVSGHYYRIDYGMSWDVKLSETNLVYPAEMC